MHFFSSKCGSNWDSPRNIIVLWNYTSACTCGWMGWYRFGYTMGIDLAYMNVLWLLLLLVRLLFFYYFSYAACELLVAGLQFGLFSTRAVVLVTVSCKRYKVEQPRKWMVYSNSHACTSFFISGDASSASFSGAVKCGFVRPPVLTTIKKIITLQLIQFECNFLCPLIPFCLWKMDCNL